MRALNIINLSSLGNGPSQFHSTCPFILLLIFADLSQTGVTSLSLLSLPEFSKLILVSDVPSHLYPFQSSLLSQFKPEYPTSLLFDIIWVGVLNIDPSES